jgi:hypothetical protein
MPSNVRYFTYLSFGSLLFGVSSFALVFRNLPGSKISGLVAGVLFMSVMISIVLPLVLVLLTSYGRQNWARWVLAALFAYEVLSSLPMLSMLVQHMSFVVVDAFARLLLQASALYFVFTGNASEWFSEAR